MDKDALLALADRVEALTGPDREVDAAIWCELNGEMAVLTPNLSYYTASLDAAMTLVPEGWGWSLYSAYEKYEDGLQPFRCALSAMPRQHIGTNGNSAPLAVCAAALRARANQ